MTTHPDDRYAELLMKAVDGVLTPDEARQWERILAASPEARRELEDLTAIKSVTDGVAARIRADAAIEPPRETPAVRIVLVLGFLLMLVGTVALLGYAGLTLATDPTVPAWVKGSAAAVTAGLLLLFAYVLRVRMRGLSRDPYRHIDL